MTKLKLNITEHAKQDIRLILNHIALDNKNAAKDLSVYLYKTCSDLTKFPQMGAKRPDLTNCDYRFFVIKKHYIIVYKIKNNDLFVLRILATYRDICTLL